MKKIIAIFTLFIMLLSVTSASAIKSRSYSLSGKVLVKKQAVEGAKVVLLKRNKAIAETLTDNKGEYSFKNIQRGRYYIKAEYNCYKPTIRKIDLKGNRNINLRLYQINKINKNNSLCSYNKCTKQGCACNKKCEKNKDTDKEKDSKNNKKENKTDSINKEQHEQKKEMFSAYIDGKAMIKGKPAAGIKLYLINGKKVIDQAVSDNNGYYKFENVSKGKFIIRAHYSCYREVAHRVNVKNNNHYKKVFNLNKATRCQLDNKIKIEGIAKVKNAAIEGINISLIKNNKIIAQTTTNIDGSYEFDNVSRGRYYIKAEYNCYKPVQTRVFARRNNVRVRSLNLYKQTCTVPRFEIPDCKGNLNFRIDVLNITNKGEGDLTDKIYVGDESTPYESGTVIPLVKNGEFIVDNNFNPKVKGLAVKRGKGYIYVYLYGSHRAKVSKKNGKKIVSKRGLEYIHGIISLDNGRFTGFMNGIGRTKLERQGDNKHIPLRAGQDEVYFVKNSTEEEFYMTVTRADDSFYIAYNCEPTIHDTTPPRITVDSHPTLTNNSEFTLTGTVNDSEATVKINGKNATVNGNRWEINVKLIEGLNTFHITAEDKAGNQAEPLTDNITLDTTPPDTFIMNTTINMDSADIHYEGTDSVYSYKLDDGEWSAWTESHEVTYTGLEDGWHVFYVRSMDDAGNIDPTPAEYRFFINTTVITTFNATIDGFLDGVGPIVELTWDRLGLINLRPGDERYEYRSVVRFNTSSIPRNARIEKATLLLTSYPNSTDQVKLYVPPSNSTILVCRITSDWNESLKEPKPESAEDNTTIPLPYYNKSDCTKFYYSGQPVAEADTTRIVQEWVNESAPEYGFMLEVTENVHRWIMFQTMESPWGGVPRLVVKYKPQTTETTLHLPTEQGRVEFPINYSSFIP